MKKTFHFVLLSCIMALLLSCSNDNLTENVSIEEDVKVVNGIVYFKNQSAFKKVMASLHENGQENLSVWEVKMGFDNSYRKKIDTECAGDEEMLDTLLIIEDPFFATVVNQDGIFVINDTIHKITYNQEFLIPNLDFDKLDNISVDFDLKSAIDGINTFEIIRTNKTKTEEKSVTWWNEIKKNYYNSDICNENLSAHLKAWCVNYAAYGSFGVRIEGRKYKKNIWGNWDWRDDEMWFAKVDACGWGGPTWSPAVKYCGSDDGTNKKNVATTLLWYSGGIVFCDSIVCTYTYEDDGCSRLTWTITWE